MAKAGVKSMADRRARLFAADCLETIEELGEENREYFEHNGGEHFRGAALSQRQRLWACR